MFQLNMNVTSAQEYRKERRIFLENQFDSPTGEFAMTGWRHSPNRYAEWPFTHATAEQHAFWNSSEEAERSAHHFEQLIQMEEEEKHMAAHQQGLIAEEEQVCSARLMPPNVFPPPVHLLHKTLNTREWAHYEFQNVITPIGKNVVVYQSETKYSDDDQLVAYVLQRVDTPKRWRRLCLLYHATEGMPEIPKQLTVEEQHAIYEEWMASRAASIASWQQEQATPLVYTWPEHCVEQQ